MVTPYDVNDLSEYYFMQSSIASSRKTITYDNADLSFEIWMTNLIMIIPYIIKRIQIMACRLVGAKPLSKPMLE